MFWSFVEAVIIAVIVMITHCYYGYTASGGPVGVGEAVGRSMRLLAGARGGRGHACLRWRSTASTRTSTSRCSRHDDADEGERAAQSRRTRRRAAVRLALVAAIGVALVYLQFRGGFTPKTPLTMLADRAGLLMDPGSKVTYNGVEIGRVASI